MILKFSFIHKPLFIDMEKKNPLLKVESDEQQ